MKTGTKYLVILMSLIVILLLSVHYESKLLSFSKMIFESEFLALFFTIAAFSVSFTHKIRYSSFKIQHLTFDQFRGFGEELFSLFATPITLAGSWSLLSAYCLQKIHKVNYFLNFSEVNLGFVCLISFFFLISSFISMWRQIDEIRKDVNPIQAVPNQDSKTQ